MLTSLTHAETLNRSKDLHLSENAWKVTEKDQGVTHYSQKIKGSGINAYKGVCIINKPIDTIFSLLSDIPSHPTWVAYCSSSSLIKKNSEDDTIQYYNFDVPWPFLNRDIVVHCTQRTDPVTGTITIDSYAVKAPVVPLKKNYLRVTDANQKWLLEQIEPGITRVTFIALTNIEGDAPNILKNLISHEIPSTSLENLKTIAMKMTTPTPNRYIAKSDIQAINQ